MSYLVCKKCGGYYTLKEGENLDDFERCECGGSLKHVSVWGSQKRSTRKYVQNFNSHFDEELDPINEVNICHDCGTKIPAGEKYCKSCKTMKKHNSSDDKNSLNKFIQDNLMLRAVAIIIGILIVLIPAFLFTSSDYSLMMLVIGGLVTSLIAGGKSEDGAINGVIMGIIASFLLLIFKGNFIFTDDIVFNVRVIVFEMSGAVLILVLFSLVGGVIGILIRDILFRSKKS